MSDASLRQSPPARVGPGSLHAARDLLRRLGRRGEATGGYRRALELATNVTERRFLERRLAEVS